MKLKFLRNFILLAGVLSLAGGAARAGDEDLFTGLIPGVPLADEELHDFYGMGTTLLINGELVNLSGAVDLSQDNNQVSSIVGNAGITTPIQFVGDDNQVTVNVILSVNIGTVTVTNPVGSSVSASAVVEFNGALDFGLAN